MKAFHMPQSCRSNELPQTIYNRCHSLKEGNFHDFGKAEDWIAKAAAAGQHAAQASISILAFTLSIVRRRTSDEDSPVSPQSSKYEDLLHMLQGAIQTRDPEVIWKIGAVQGYLNQSDDDKLKNQLAWWLVSCQRGYDCSSGADWVKVDCIDESYCVTGISGIDYIRNEAGTNWPEIQQRTEELNAKLDAGQWDDLGLSSKLTP